MKHKYRGLLLFLITSAFLGQCQKETFTKLYSIPLRGLWDQFIVRLANSYINSTPEHLY